jgi:hypothetical protein
MAEACARLSAHEYNTEQRQGDVTAKKSDTFVARQTEDSLIIYSHKREKESEKERESVCVCVCAV